MPSKTTAEVTTAWSNSAAHWERYAERISELFAPLTDALLQAARLERGLRVLDVAGGVGDPALEIAKRVGQEGSVVCTDAAAEMVAAAHRRAKACGLENIAFEVCLADALPFADESFERAVSRLGAMFFVEIEKALREMLRVLRAAGTLALAVWGAENVNPFFTSVSEILARYVAPEPEEADAPGAFRFSAPDKLAAILRAVGGREVTETVFDFQLSTSLSPVELWQVRSEMSDSLRAKLRGLNAAQRHAIDEEVIAAWSHFTDNASGGVRMPAQCLIVTARK